MDFGDKLLGLTSHLLAVISNINIKVILELGQINQLLFQGLRFSFE